MRRLLRGAVVLTAFGVLAVAWACVSRPAGVAHGAVIIRSIRGGGLSSPILVALAGWTRDADARFNPDDALPPLGTCRLVDLSRAPLSIEGIDIPLGGARFFDVGAVAATLSSQTMTFGRQDSGAWANVYGFLLSSAGFAAGSTGSVAASGSAGIPPFSAPIRAPGALRVTSPLSTNGVPSTVSVSSGLSVAWESTDSADPVVISPGLFGVDRKTKLVCSFPDTGHALIPAAAITQSGGTAGPLEIGKVFLSSFVASAAGPTFVDIGSFTSENVTYVP